MTTHQAPPVPDVVHEASPLDREPYLSLIQAVLAWSARATTPHPRDCQQITVLLAGHAHALTEDLRRRCTHLPADSTSRTLTETVLGEADRRLSVEHRATVAGAQNLARLVRALYQRLDHLHLPAHRPPPEPAAAASRSRCAQSAATPPPASGDTARSARPLGGPAPEPGPVRRPRPEEPWSTRQPHRHLRP
ncbi:DUF6415 family natural product biosynthesis protein [Streptomyces longispororuber]|uniref:DUF6415 family natural product biosynthesis protein n=1 Tax=Streptomyces longispororuber TaxID=68230 RepID=UPI0036F58990